MFWSGADFEEEALNVQGNKFKDASIFYTDISEVDPSALTHWLQKAIVIQWDYKNIVKRKGKLERIITQLDLMAFKYKTTILTFFLYLAYRLISL